MKKQVGHIIESLLDLDFYKLTMGQLVFYLYTLIPVKYGFKNRTKKVVLTKFIKLSALKRELDHARTLRFTEKEIDYLRGMLDSYQKNINLISSCFGFLSAMIPSV